MKDIGDNVCVAAVMLAIVLAVFAFNVIDSYNDLEEHTQAFSSGLQECIDQNFGSRNWQKECK